MSSSSGATTDAKGEVRDGTFSYHPDTGFLVDGVPRCHKTQLLEHLAFVDPGPALTKKGTPRVRQPPRPQDQSVEFYRAQMAHYGVHNDTGAAPTREAAKRLLSGSSLEVTGDVLKAQSRLKALYDTNVWQQTLWAKLKDQLLREKVARDLAADPTASLKRQRVIDEAENRDQNKNSSAKRQRQNDAQLTAKPHIDLKAISGSYLLSAEVTVAPMDEFDDPTVYNKGFHLKLALSPQRSHVWGYCDFGAFYGYLRSTSPLDSPDCVIHFHWCGVDRENEDGTFGPDNKCTVEFLSGGNVKGTLYASQKCQSGVGISFSAPFSFTGRRVKSKKREDVDELKNQYRRLYADQFQGGDDYTVSFDRWLRESEFGSDTEEEDNSTFSDLDAY